MIREDLRALPAPLRWAIVAGAFLGAIGSVAGLNIGLFANPPTAWFALFELGVPSSIVGSLLGLIAGCFASMIGRMRRSSN